MHRRKFLQMSLGCAAGMAAGLTAGSGIALAITPKVTLVPKDVWMRLFRTEKELHAYLFEAKVLPSLRSGKNVKIRTVACVDYRPRWRAVLIDINGEQEWFLIPHDGSPTLSKEPATFGTIEVRMENDHGTL